MGEAIKVLCIDDNETDRELVKNSLEKEHGGFEIKEASCKEEFESCIDREKFDIIISDFNILGFEGLDIIRNIQQRAPETPVVIVTGTGSEEIAVKSFRMGVSDYVIKQPQHIRLLPVTLLAVLEKNRLKIERQSAEKSRDEALHRLELALRFSRVRFWDWDLKTNKVFFSGDLLHQLGLSGTFQEGSYDDLIKRVHPDDEKEVLKILQKYLNHEIQYFDVEFRLRHENGDYIWIQSLGEVIEDATGKPERMLGCHHDISEKKKNEMRLIEALEEKEHFLNEIDHKVKNNLQIIISLLRIQEECVSNAEVKNALNTCQNRFRSMALIHDTLFSLNKQKEIEAHSFFLDIALQALQKVPPEKNKPELQVETGGLFLPINLVTPLGQIVSELVLNSVIHGFKAGQKGKIDIRLKQNTVSGFELTISDNGIGFPEDLDWRQPATFGFKLILMMVESQLEGTVHREKGKGTCFVFRFPGIKNAANQKSFL